ncbi:MAG TPA: response regulator, partial [Tepidisphaeraceae bacterium]|nr:response regulator [Tepidisphaeraceae bacterium]
VKAERELKETILISLLSAQAQNDPSHLRAAGFAGQMVKPVRQSQLFDVIMNAMANSSKATSAQGTHDCKTGDSCPILASRGARILLAEDNRVNQIVASEILRNHGFRFEVVADGRKAVQAACAGGYDLVLMDCQMPEMDGFEATQAIRRWETEAPANQKHLPIIALTANAIKGDRDRCLEAGMDAYVSKPINAKRLVETIESLLTKPGDVNGPAGTALPSNQSGENAPATPDAADSDSAPFSTQALMEICMGNPVTALQALQEFKRQVEQDLPRFQTSLSVHDSKGFASLAHALSGSAGFLRAQKLQQISADLEKMGRDDELASANGLLDALREELRRCLDYLPAAQEMVSKNACTNTEMIR